MMGWYWDIDGYTRNGNFLQFANLKMAIDIVDLPINSMLIFHSYVNVYQRVSAWFYEPLNF